MSPHIDTLSRYNSNRISVAQTLNFNQRQEIALKAIGNKAAISQIATHLGVSRKFVYEQKAIALHGIKEAFTPPSSDNCILFSLPVTKEWMKQFILGVILIGHSSYQGVVELLRDLFDYAISKGNVHNIVYENTNQSTTRVEQRQSGCS